MLLKILLSPREFSVLPVTSEKRIQNHPLFGVLFPEALYHPLKGNTNGGKCLPSSCLGLSSPKHLSCWLQGQVSQRRERLWVGKKKGGGFHSTELEKGLKEDPLCQKRNSCGRAGWPGSKLQGLSPSSPCSLVNKPGNRVGLQGRFWLYLHFFCLHPHQ